MEKGLGLQEPHAPLRPFGDVPSEVESSGPCSLELDKGFVSLPESTPFGPPGGVAGLLGDRPSALILPLMGLDASLSTPELF